MNVSISFLYNLLLPAPFSGLLWSLFLFVFCFLGIHVLKLAQLGWSQTRKPTQPPPPEPVKKQEEKTAPAPKQEPIYYIVERKQRRSKPSYGEPKEIRFK